MRVRCKWSKGFYTSCCCHRPDSVKGKDGHFLRGRNSSIPDRSKINKNKTRLLLSNLFWSSKSVQFSSSFGSSPFLMVVCSREKAPQSQFLSAVFLISIHIHFVLHPNNSHPPVPLPPSLTPEFLSNFPHFLLHRNQFSWAHISFFIGLVPSNNLISSQ